MADAPAITHSPAASSGSRAALTIVGGTLVAMALCAVCCALVALLINTPDAWRGLLAGGVAGAIATLISLVPIALAANRPFTQRLTGYAIGSAARALITVTITVLAIRLGDYPKWETLGFAFAFYVTLLVAEVAIVSYNARAAGVAAK